MKKGVCPDLACVLESEHSLSMDELKGRFKHFLNKGIRVEDISSYWFAVRTIKSSGF